MGSSRTALGASGGGGGGSADGGEGGLVLLDDGHVEDGERGVQSAAAFD